MNIGIFVNFYKNYIWEYSPNYQFYELNINIDWGKNIWREYGEIISDCFKLLVAQHLISNHLCSIKYIYIKSR